MREPDLPLLILSLLAGSVGGLVGGAMGKFGVDVGIFTESGPVVGGILGLVVCTTASFLLLVAIAGPGRRPPPLLPPKRPQIIGAACCVCDNKILWVNEGSRCESCDVAYCRACAADGACPSCARQTSTETP